jgi:hypothetical protein
MMDRHNTQTREQDEKREQGRDEEEEDEGEERGGGLSQRDRFLFLCMPE